VKVKRDDWFEKEGRGLTKRRQVNWRQLPDIGADRGDTALGVLDGDPRPDNEYLLKRREQCAAGRARESRPLGIAAAAATGTASDIATQQQQER